MGKCSILLLFPVLEPATYDREILHSSDTIAGGVTMTFEIIFEDTVILVTNFMLCTLPMRKHQLMVSKLLKGRSVRCWTVQARIFLARRKHVHVEAFTSNPTKR